MNRPWTARRWACPLAMATAALLSPVIPAAAQDAATTAQPPRQKTYQEIVDERNRTDWAFLSRYRDDNAKVTAPARGGERVVFFGDSITEGWGRVKESRFFPGKPYLNRGISGQTTPQMLVRFRQDVVALRPRVVVILAGINDIAGNTGPMTLTQTEDNIHSMVEIAKANGIAVVLSSVLPAYDFPWRPGMKPAEKVVELNAHLKDYAAKNGLTYLDYFTPMADDRKGLKAELTYDGVHPNAAGYAVMEPLAAQAIQKAIAAKAPRR